MAEENKKKEESFFETWISHPDPFVQFVWLILTIFIFLYIFGFFVDVFNRRFLGDVSDKSKIVSLSEAPNLIGDSVETNKITPVFNEPGDKIVFSESKGTKGVLKQGPLVRDDGKYWYVKFNNGDEGWVREDYLNHLSITKEPISNIEDPIGGRVSVFKNGTPVLYSASGDQVGVKNSGDEGRVVGGPIIKNGIKYWKIEFDDGLVGWVDENDLAYLKTKSTPLDSIQTLVGGSVLTNKYTELFDSPDGAVLKGIKSGTLGKIIEGPIIKNGEKYWHIKFDNGDEGWVREDDLNYVVGSESSLLNLLKKKLLDFYSIFKIISIILSILLAVFIFILFKKLKELRKAEIEKIYLKEEVAVSSLVNREWERVLNNIESNNESDWRLAIMEADIMLENLLKSLGLVGDTIGEKMKTVEKSDFTTIDNAWEAHKIRNQIAHEGGNFMINQHEAKRVISLYKSVFEEFRII